MEHLQEWVQKATTDKEAEESLRDLIFLASNNAPTKDIVRLGETLLEILKDGRKENAEKN